jgi:RNA polymerase sigma-B factor
MSKQGNSGGSPSGEPDRASGLEESRADEAELLRRFHRTGNPEIREELVRRFLPLARSLAMRYRSGGEPSDDLVQVASLGLIGAIDRFDPERGVPFPAFAAPTILGELRRHFRDRVWALRVPRGLQERIADVDAAIAKLSATLERSPSVREVAAHLALDEGEVLEAIHASEARRTISLDQPVSSGDPDAAPMSERLGDEDPRFELVDHRAAIHEGAAELSGLEREVLRLRFVEDLTQSKIAERIGYSQMHVSRLIRKAIERLREVTREPPDAGS